MVSAGDDALPVMRVAVLTTSYPRRPGDPAGQFVGAAVERLRARGVEVDVVSPASFRHWGIAYGSGVTGNLRARPWLAAALPLFFTSFRRAAARAAHDADLVHAHWLAAGAVAATVRKPYVVQVWGTDVQLARLMPWLARVILRRAHVVIAASNALAADARRLGARDVRVIPSGVDVPDDARDPDEPPHVLYVGRLSKEQGILDLVQAAHRLPLVVVGDGPLRNDVPAALGFVPHDELGAFYERASVIACPSHREGFGVVAVEAMAHGRPVVASAVGGLRDIVADGETGMLVPPGDIASLRSALERLLGDAELRRSMGEAARARVREHFSWDATTDATLAAYDETVRRVRLGGS